MTKLFLALFLFLISYQQKLANSETCSSLELLDDSVDSTGYVNLHGRLRVNGIQLVDSHNQSIQLLGIATHGLQYYPKCYTRQSITHFVKTWGITVLRITVYIEDGGYRENPYAISNKIQDLVQICTELGIYAVIDWHVLDPGDPNHYLDSVGGSTGLAVDFWTKMATLYKNYNNVIYELCNEPNDISYPYNIPWSTVLAYLNSVISIIRKIDPEAIIIAGVPSWSQDLQYPANIAVDQPYNVMYAFHFYAGTHEYLLPKFENYSNQVPIFVSEWGVSSFTGLTQPNLDVSDEFLKAFNSKNISVSWISWNLSDKENELNAILNGSCADKDWDNLSCGGVYLRNQIVSKRKSDPTAVPSLLSTSIPTAVSQFSVLCEIEDSCQVSQVHNEYVDVHGWECDDSNMVIRDTVCDGNWYGITCDKYNNIITLNLSHMELQCKLSDSIDNLSYLETLYLSYNRFEDSHNIPQSIQNIDTLKHLSISHINYDNQSSNNMLLTNMLSVMRSLNHLEYLDISSNNFTNMIITSDICESPLKTLNMSNNDFICISQCLKSKESLINFYYDESIAWCSNDKESIETGYNITPAKVMILIFCFVIGILLITVVIYIIKYRILGGEDKTTTISEENNDTRKYTYVSIAMTTKSVSEVKM